VIRPVIQIIAMRSWGELGNLLAARTLAPALTEGLGNVRVQVLEAEDFFPRLASIGARIERLARAEVAPADRRMRYLQLLAPLAERFFSGFEVADASRSLAGELELLVRHLQRTQPDVVIGMKGLVSRLCLAAARRAGADPGVVNFVTNEGLLRLEIHRSPHLPLNLVPFESGRSYLVEKYDFAQERVRVVGRLLAQPQVGAAFSADRRGPAMSAGAFTARRIDDARMVVLANRGGDAYLRLLEHMATRHRSLPVVFVALRDPGLAAAAQMIATGERLDTWSIFEGLTQTEYLRCLTWLRECSVPILVTKTGPNTVLEAAACGLPQLLLESGLPMETWVGPFVAEYGLGLAFTYVDDLLSQLESWLRHPVQVAFHRRCAVRFATAYLDQAEARARLVAALTEVLDRAPEPRAVTC
jgi:hypothetical protein